MGLNKYHMYGYLVYTRPFLDYKTNPKFSLQKYLCTWHAAPVTLAPFKAHTYQLIIV